MTETAPSPAALRPDPIVARENVTAPLVQIFVGIVFTLSTYGIPLLVSRDFGEGLGIVAAVVAVALPTVLLLQLSLSAYIYYWLSLVLLQNAVVGLWLPDNFGGEVPLIVTEVKTVSLLIAVILSLPLIVRLLAKRRTVLWFTLVYFVWIVVSVRGLDTATFAYGRNFIFPLLLLLFVGARASGLDLDFRLQLLRRLLAYTIVVLTAGVVAELAITTGPWRVLLNTDKLGSLGGVSDTTRFFGLRIDRTAGFIVEPTNAGYIAAICAVLLILSAIAARGVPTASWWLQFVASVWLLIESGARSGFLMLVLSLIVVVLWRLRIPPVRLFIAGCVSAFALVLVYVSIVKSPAAVIKSFGDPPSLVGGDSTTFHLAGLMSGIQRGVQTVIGHGLGRGGNFSSIGGGEGALKGAEKVATGGESAWGVLSYQTGIVGLLLLIVVLVLIGREWGPLTLVALTVWSITAMFAEASFGLQVSAVLMIGAALLRGAGMPVLSPGGDAVALETVGGGAQTDSGTRPERATSDRLESRPRTDEDVIPIISTPFQEDRSVKRPDEPADALPDLPVSTSPQADDAGPDLDDIEIEIDRGEYEDEEGLSTL